jgi:hypothetical protein
MREREELGWHSRRGSDSSNSGVWREGREMPALFRDATLPPAEVGGDR